MDRWEIRVDYSQPRIDRLMKICNELNDRLTFTRALAAYALETHRLDVYLIRLREYIIAERQLVIYRYLIGREWGRVTGVRARTLPPVLDVASWV